jgi:hypothetical protein
MRTRPTTTATTMAATIGRKYLSLSRSPPLVNGSWDSS